MEYKFLVTFLALFLIQINHAQLQTRPLSTGLNPNYNVNPSFIGNTGFLNPELQNPGFGNRAAENTGLWNANYANGIGLAENAAFNGVHGNLANRMALAEDVTFNGIRGNLANHALAENLAINQARGNVANGIGMAENMAFNGVHGNQANRVGFAENMAYNGVHGNLANRMALAEDVAFNGVYGSLANGMAMNPSFSNMAGFTQDGGFTGGNFIVSSSSPLSPNGVSVKSDNLLVEGPLSITGQMPFLGVVSMEGGLPATGQGAVSYKCGNGDVGMVGENAPLNGNYGITGRQNDRFLPNGFY